MRILHRHIRATVISMTMLVVMVIAGVQTFIGVIAELHSIGQSQYGVLQALIYVLLSLPYNLYPLFPAAALIGCLIGLGRLAAQSELVVMRTSGVSKAQITFSVIRSAIVMLVFVTLIGEWLAPNLNNYADDYKYQKQNNNDRSDARYGFWLRNGENFILINSAVAPGQIANVMRYEFSQRQLTSASVAATGEFKNGRWLLSQVRESVLQPNQVVAQQLAEQVWPINLDPKLLADSHVHPDNTTLLGLKHYIDFLHAAGLGASLAEFTWWKRVFQPLVTLVMIGLAVPFIFGPLRSVTMGLRILIGVSIGFGFYTLNEFLGPFTLVYHVPPIASAVFPVLLFLIIDGILLLVVQ